MFCPAGAYTCVEFRLVAQRNAGYYVMTMVLPTIVIVALSWSTFFIPVNLPTPRLAAALVLALSSLAMNVLCRTALAPELKQASYITVIDLWTSCCFLFVVAALILQLVIASRAATHQQVRVSVYTAPPTFHPRKFTFLSKFID